jgi:hypothetical protein
MSNEPDSPAYVAYQLAREDSIRVNHEPQISFAARSVKNRMKVGDLINHHGFLGIVTFKGNKGFAFETLENGKANGETFVCEYDSLLEKDPKACWTTEQ